MPPRSRALPDEDTVADVEQGRLPTDRYRPRKRVVRKRPQTEVVETTNPDGSPRKKKRYDWPRIAALYIEGEIIDEDTMERRWLTLEQVAQHFGIVSARVRERSAQDRWSTQRAAFQGRIREQRQRDRADELSKESLDIDTKGLNVAKLGLQLTLSRLAEVAKDSQRYQVRREKLEQQLDAGMPVDLKQLRSAVNYREMEGLANAATQFHNLGRRALGDDVQRHEISGPGGGAIETHTEIDVREELLRDDPERLAKMLEAAGAAGLLDLLMQTEDVNDDIEDAEVIDTDNNNEQQPAIEGEHAS